MEGGDVSQILSECLKLTFRGIQIVDFSAPTEEIIM